YDTAWAFAFAGAALIAHAIGFDRVGRLCAAVPIVLGALRIIAYIAPGAIRIHPILANPALPYGAGNYNDMGVLTALVFVVMGSGLGSLRAVMRGPWHSVLIAMLASVALALVLLLLFGAWTGGTAASGLLLTGGDRSQIYGFTEEQWRQDAGALLRDVPEFQALAWAGEDLAIRWTAPLPRPDSPVYDLRAEPGQRLGIDSMVSTRRPAVTRFVNLAGGKKGFAILVPKYVGDSLRGM